VYFSLLLISGVSVFPVYSIGLKYKRHSISNSWYGYVEENISGEKAGPGCYLATSLALVRSCCLAGVQGFEPQLADPESAVLPLNDTPKLFVREEYHTLTIASCQAMFWRDSLAM
jgi:hypothetical protein